MVPPIENEEKREAIATYQVFYSEEHKRDFYVDPASKTTTWYAPNVSTVEDEEKTELANETTPKSSGKSVSTTAVSKKDYGGGMAMICGAVFLLLLLHAWAKLWLPEGSFPNASLSSIKSTISSVLGSTPPPISVEPVPVEDTKAARRRKKIEAVKKAGKFLFTPWVLLLKDSEKDNTTKDL